jgi:hypothetical protein
VTIARNSGYRMFSLATGAQTFLCWSFFPSRRDHDRLSRFLSLYHFRLSCVPYLRVRLPRVIASVPLVLQTFTVPPVGRSAERNIHIYDFYENKTPKVLGGLAVTSSVTNAQLILDTGFVHRVRESPLSEGRRAHLSRGVKSWRMKPLHSAR